MAEIDTLLQARATVASPAFTGTPTAPTASPGDNSTKVATTGFVDTAIAAVVAGVSSVFGRTGAVVATSGDYAVADITGAAPLASPAFTGTPTAPTPATADNSTKVATTAFVKAQGYLTANAVTSVHGRTGAVVSVTGDYTAAEVTNAADKSSASTQAFTGIIEAPMVGALSGNAIGISGGAITVTNGIHRITTTDSTYIETINGPSIGLLALRNNTGAAITYTVGGNIINPPANVPNGTSSLFIFDGTQGRWVFLMNYASG